MAVGDFITKEEALLNYKIVDFIHDDMITSQMLFDRDTNTYGYGSEVAKATAINPTGKIPYYYQNVGDIFQAIPMIYRYTITNTKTFRIVNFDSNFSTMRNKSSFKYWCMVDVNGCEYYKDLTKNVKDTGTENPYILYELTDLDPKRLYSITITMGSTFYKETLDCALIDKNGKVIAGNGGFAINALEDPLIPSKSTRYGSYSTGKYLDGVTPFTRNFSKDNDNNYDYRVACSTYIKGLYKKKIYNIDNDVVSYDGSARVSQSGSTPLGTSPPKYLPDGSVGNTYKFAVIGSKYVDVVGYGYYTYSYDSDILIDDIPFNKLSSKLYTYDNYREAFGWNTVYASIEMDAKNIHTVAIRKNTTAGASYIDGFVVEDGAMILPYNIDTGYDRFILEKGEDLFVKKKVVESKKVNDAILVSDINNVSEVVMYGKNKYTLKGSTGKFIRPRKTDLICKTLESYETKADIPKIWTQSYYDLGSAIASGTFPLINNMKAIPIASSVFSYDSKYDDNYGYAGVGNYSYGSKYIYNTPPAQSSGWTDAKKHENPISISGNVDITNAKQYANFTMTNCYHIPIKTTSSFISFWTLLNVQDTTVMTQLQRYNSALSYYVFVNGVMKMMGTNQFSKDRTALQYEHAEIFRIDGLQPEDQIDIYLCSLRGSSDLIYWGLGIDKTATWETAYIKKHNFEEVDEYEGCYDDLDNSFFTNSSELTYIVKSINTKYGYNSVDIVNTNSGIDKAIVKYKDTGSLVNISRDSINFSTMAYSGLSTNDIKDLISTGVDMSEYNLISLGVGDIEYYGLDDSSAMYKSVVLDNVDLNTLLNQDTIKLEKGPDITGSVGANTYISGTDTISEFVFPNDGIPITKVVI